VRTGATDGPNSAGNYSDEPTGLGYDNDTDTLFVSDDTGIRSVYVVKPGADGLLGTTDYVVVQINMSNHGAADTEDPEFDPVTGHLFVLGGTDREVFRIDPVDGIFGNGNDVVTSIDISHLGPTDFEGMTSSVSRRTLFVGARTSGQIFEITHDGQLVRTINVDIPGNSFISGLAMAPSSVDPSVMSLWIVDRGADEVLDGQIFEIAVPDLDEPLGNLPPLVDAGPDQAVVYPNSVTLNGSVIDDGNPEDGVLTHTWSKVIGPGDVTFGDATALSTTAAFSQVGIYVLELWASDGQFSSSDTMIVTVEAPPNQPPTIDPIDDVTVAEGDTVVVDVSVFDPDGDDLTITTEDLPAFASFDPVTRQITISPLVGDVGLYGPVTVTVSDADVAQAPVFRSSASAAITSANGSILTIARPAGVDPGDLMIAQIRYRNTVDGPNLTPPEGWVELGTIVDNSQSHHTVLYKFAGLSEPVQYSFDQNSDAGRMAGGIGAYIGVDPTEPIHAWAASSANTAALVAPGIATLIDETTIVRAWGWRGPDGSDEGVGFNLPPDGVTSRWTEQTGGGTFTDRNRVLGGDHVQATAGVVDAATASGSASEAENRRSAFTIALAPASIGDSASTTFNITVTEGETEPVNSPPVAVDDSASTVQDTAVDIDVLLNDSDADGDLLSVVNLAQPSNGAAAVNPDGTVRYTPDAGFTGVDSFTYQASDGVDVSNVATVTVTVTEPDPVNSAPVAADDSASTTAGVAVTVHVLANDTDVDGDALSVENLSDPSNGSVVVNVDHSVTYMPDAGFTGVDSFTYQASDGELLSNVATVTVTVRSPGGGGGGGGGGPAPDPVEVGGILVERPCIDDVPPAGFSDVSPTSVHALDIDCLVHVGVATGVGSGLYDPLGDVTRWQMALFLIRSAEVLGLDVPVAVAPFTDLGGLSDEAVAAIGSLAAMGVTTGTSVTEYAPFEPVTRWQMALFLIRLHALTDAEPPAAPAHGFQDLAALDEETINAINQLAHLGVTLGTTATTYSPDEVVSREQMASLLARLIRLVGVSD
jgi:hypothetical protein